MIISREKKERQILSNNQKETKEDDLFDYAYIDWGSDTCGIGEDAWIIDSISNRKVTVSGYNNDGSKKKNIRIGDGITATDLPTRETVLIKINEATLLEKGSNTLISTLQVRENGVEVDEKAKRHGGKSMLKIDDIIIPLTL